MNESATPTSPEDVLDWKGTDRYEIRRCIGRGGMGVVYEAFDRERQHPVALKAMLHSDPTSLYLFKQEFRTLAHVHHVNLVHLHEFVAEAERVFFTMELVRGVDFVQHVQVPEPPESAERLVAATRRLRPRGSDPAPPQDEETNSVPPRVRGSSPAVVERLRPALRQLVQGVHALHLAGKLHRDIKPSNVLVTGEGRVVLLDFGVAAELSTVARERRQRGEMVGTAAYMAPEQVDDAPPTAAADWYSVGVMLFKALVGELPFAGSAFRIMELKCSVDPPLASTMAAGVPAALDDLCRAPGIRVTASTRHGPWSPPPTIATFTSSPTSSTSRPSPRENSGRGRHDENYTLPRRGGGREPISGRVGDAVAGGGPDALLDGRAPRPGRRAAARPGPHWLVRACR